MSCTGFRRELKRQENNNNSSNIHTSQLTCLFLTYQKTPNLDAKFKRKK